MGCGMEQGALTVAVYRGRKQLDHNNLNAEVIAQMSARFDPDVAMIKKRIEGLIEREYLERIDDGKGQPVYKYLA